MIRIKRNPKAARLKENDSLNLHPERVRAKQFHNGTFFDPRDLVQVKYEMLREVSHEGASKVQAAASYGLSRQAFYQALKAFTRGGITGSETTLSMTSTAVSPENGTVPVSIS